MNGFLLIRSFALWIIAKVFADMEIDFIRKLGLL
jgi:hypothetical protein